MGLEAVEIVMAVEEAFDIVIEDADASGCLTPGEVIDLVLRKVGNDQPDACLTQRAFHRFRAAAMSQLGWERKRIRPETPLAGLFPWSTRQSQLRQVFRAMEVDKELELVRPEWLSRLLVTGMFGGGALVALYLFWHPARLAGWGSPVMAGLAFTALSGLLGFWFTRRFRREFTPTLSTVAQLARWIAAHAPQAVAATPGQWNREQVAEIVRSIVIEHLGCEKQYREDARFVEDLGMG